MCYRVQSRKRSWGNDKAEADTLRFLGSVGYAGLPWYTGQSPKTPRQDVHGTAQGIGASTMEPVLDHQLSTPLFTWLAPPRPVSCCPTADHGFKYSLATGCELWPGIQSIVRLSEVTAQPTSVSPSVKRD